jgi:hypothetical protein
VEGEELTLERIAIKVKRPGRKKALMEETRGFEASAESGPLVHKRRLIDRGGDRYVERVLDSKTGDVLRDCDERLTDHRGRGSAKARRKHPPKDC